jgi:hypothetical protein
MLLWKMGFPAAKISRVHRTCRRALPKPAGCEPRRALLRFFDMLRRIFFREKREAIEKILRRQREWKGVEI